MQGLHECAVDDSFSGVVDPVAVGIQSESGSNGLAAHGELGGIEYLDGAVLDASDVSIGISLLLEDLAQVVSAQSPVGGEDDGRRDAGSLELLLVLCIVDLRKYILEAVVVCL